MTRDVPIAAAPAGSTLPGDCWYAIALASSVSRTQPLSVAFQRNELVVTRQANGQVVVRQARCAHRGCSLSTGWIADGLLRCPYHGWAYNDAGQCVHIPALRAEESIPHQARVGVLPSAEHYGLVWAWIGDKCPEPSHGVADIPELRRPGMEHQRATDLSYDFNSHFSRSIENGIDPTHAPFTHGSSIGKADPTIDLSFPPYAVTQEPGALAAQMPIKVNKLNGLIKFLLKGDADTIYKAYRFIHPNLLLSLVNFGRFTLVALQAHVPTGDRSTLCLNTNYRNFMRNTPLLTSWFNGVTRKTGIKIMLEDDRIIKDQVPEQVTYSGSNEILVESDHILIQFRKMMRQN